MILQSKKIRILLVLILGLFTNAAAKIKLSSVFSNGMVLQQRASTAIWGYGNPGLAITINTSWNNKSVVAVPSANGYWKIKVATPVGGGPYQITIKDNEETLTLSDVLIGEVWLASGQSNMEMPMKGFKDQPVSGSEKAIQESDDPTIRFFNIKNVTWKKPLDNCEATWISASKATTANFSAVAYFYAKMLKEKLNVPIGIIEADNGATLVQAWMSKESLEGFGEAVMAPAFADTANVNKNVPAGLYNGMINPVVGYNIKGAIWYQGEQNRDNPTLYAKLFPAMVKQWRTDWGIGNFPFYYVQIAPYLSGSRVVPVEVKALAPTIPWLREVQAQSLKQISNSGMAVITDIGSPATIHPPDKENVANRLALIALSKTYNYKDIDYAGPTYKSMSIKNEQIILKFDNAEGLNLKNTTSSNFEIAGKDQVFYRAKAIMQGAEVVVSADKVKDPVAVRYAYKAWAKGDLFNGAGLPASSFRTDSWAIMSPHPEKALGWQLGAQAYTFNRFNFAMALNKIDSCNLDYVEAFPGQLIGGSTPEKMDYKMSEANKLYLKQLLKSKNIDLVSYGVIKTKDNTEWRKIFAFAKEMGIKTITLEPEEVDLQLVSDLCDEFEINAAIHNHPNPSHYWNPDVVLNAIKGKSKRLGACADIGHWVRSGLDPIACLKKLEGHIYGVHLKDLNEKGIVAAHDVHWGTGVSNIEGVMNELKRQGYKGMISAEYEYNWFNNVPDVRQSVINFRAIVAK